MAAISGHLNLRIQYSSGPVITMDFDPIQMIRVVEQGIRGENLAVAGHREVLLERIETQVFLRLGFALTADMTALLTWWRNWASKGLQSTVILDRLSSAAGQWEYDNFNTFFTKAELLNNPFPPIRSILARARYLIELQFRQGQ